MIVYILDFSIQIRPDTKFRSWYMIVTTKKGYCDSLASAGTISGAHGLLV